MLYYSKLINCLITSFGTGNYSKDLKYIIMVSQTEQIN